MPYTPRRKTIHVSIGVIQNNAGLFFISCRPPKSSHSGLWEFPGGKRKENERPEQTLKRELNEEIGITVRSAKRLGTIDLNERLISLDIFHIIDYEGDCHGAEQQDFKWVKPSMLYMLPFPYAHSAIMNLLKKHNLINEDEGLSLSQLRDELIEKDILKSNKIKAAYNHAEHLPERRIMMDKWSDYLDGLRDNRSG